MTVWDDEHPQAALAATTSSAALLKRITEASDKQIAALAPARRGIAGASSARSSAAAVDVVIGRTLPRVRRARIRAADGEIPRAATPSMARCCAIRPQGEELPVVILHPKKWTKRVVVWLDERAKAGLYGSDGQPQPAGAATARRRRGRRWASTCVYQGEFLADGKPLDRSPQSRQSARIRRLHATATIRRCSPSGCTTC